MRPVVGGAAQPVALFSSDGSAIASSGGIIIANGEGHLGQVGGATRTITDLFTRPADTTAYAAGDAIAATTSNSATTALRELALIGRVAGGTGYIVGVRLETNNALWTPRIRVRFYTVAQPTSAVPGDNSPMTLAWANRAQRVGYVDLPAMATGQSGSDAAQSMDATLRIPFTCADGSTSLYYRLEILDAATPASGQSFFLAVSVEQN